MKYQLILTLLLVFGFISNVQSQPYVIVNTDDYIIPKSDIEDIFLLKLPTINGQKITIFIKSISSVEHDLFVYEWLYLSKSMYKRRIRYANKVNLKEVNNDVDMVLSVSNTPNSIGYIDDIRIINGRKNIAIYKLEH
jgi:hypothetical protein